MLIKLSKLKSVLPALSSKSFKGDNGKIGIIGGSENYTGAPYFASYAGMYSGAELVYIFTHKQAIKPLKILCPDCILCDYSQLKEVEKWIFNIKNIIIGPGLGRSDSIVTNFKFYLSLLKGKNVIFDADSFYLFQANTNKNNNLFLNLKYVNNIIYTPNFNELNRLYNMASQNNKNILLNDFYNDIENILNNNNIEDNGELFIFELKFEELSNYKTITNIIDIYIYLQQFNNNTYLLIKSKYDILVYNNTITIIYSTGSLKRCGGIGDMLTGILASALNYTVNNNDINLKIILASLLLKKSSKLAYDNYQISTNSKIILKYLSKGISKFIKEINNN